MNFRLWTRYGIMAIGVTVLFFSIFKIAVYYIDAYKSKEQMEEMREVYRDQTKRNGSVETLAAAVLHAPSQQTLQSQNELQWQPKLKVQERFLPLLEKNNDIVGWVNIADTVIDYPVFKSDDNEFYLKRDSNKDKNTNGSIFMDFRSLLQNKGKHTILYGHNMKNKTMFAVLLNYESRWFLEQHPIIEFDSLYEDQKWQIFSVHFTDPQFDYIRTDFKDKEDYKGFLDDLKEMSLHDTGVEVDDNDVILTLSTCSLISDVGRFAVHAKLIKNP